jgi:hypothetical protein
MNLFQTVLAVVSGVSFLAYGASCAFGQAMRVEFERYGLSSFRALVGYLELAGGLGVLVGMLERFRLIGTLSAAGLCLLMVCGIVVRIRIGDPVYLILPAVILCIVNFWLAAIGVL